MTLGRLAILIIALTLVAQAQAQSSAGPPVHPSRDVDVTYRMVGGDKVLTERMRWQAATQRQRVDPPTEGLFIVIDYRQGRMHTVRMSDRLVLDMAAPPLATGAYVRQGDDHVAGLACTDWQAMASDGQPTVACITADGVLLRATAGDRTLLTAVSVDYEPQDPALFALPDGFTVRAVEDGQ